MSNPLDVAVVNTVLVSMYGNAPVHSTLEPLRGDASSRRYYRLHFSMETPGMPQSLIVMQLADQPNASDEVTSGPKPEKRQFLDVQALLAERGVPVPAIHYSDLDAGIIVLEDLGDQTLEATLHTLPKNTWHTVYQDIVKLLAMMHQACRKPEPGCVVYQRGFDADLLLWELEHFREWGLEAPYSPLPASILSELRGCFSTIVEHVQHIPQAFCHRDFQSRNLMHTPQRAGGPWTVIDFQDALLGPRPYDLVALLCDSYLDIDPSSQTSLIQTYAQQMGFSAEETTGFVNEFWWVALQRKLKDAGRFIFIDRVRKNPAFLPYYVPSLRYVQRALDKLPNLEPLKTLVLQSLENYPKSLQV